MISTPNSAQIGVEERPIAALGTVPLPDGLRLHSNGFLGTLADARRATIAGEMSPDEDANRHHR
jgi:hypothetical protein